MHTHLKNMMLFSFLFLCCLYALRAVVLVKFRSWFTRPRGWKKVKLLVQSWKIALVFFG